MGSKMVSWSRLDGNVTKTLAIFDLKNKQISYLEIQKYIVFLKINLL